MQAAVPLKGRPIATRARHDWSGVKFVGAISGMLDIWYLLVSIINLLVNHDWYAAFNRKFAWLILDDLCILSSAGRPLMIPLVASLAGATPALESKRSFAHLFSMFLLLVSVNLHRARRDLHSYCSVFSSLWPVTARLDITAYFWHIRQVKRIRSSPCSGQKKLVGGLEHVLFSHILGISSSQLTNSYCSEGLAQHTKNIPPAFFFLRRLLSVGSWSPFRQLRPARRSDRSKVPAKAHRDAASWRKKTSARAKPTMIWSDLWTWGMLLTGIIDYSTKMGYGSWFFLVPKIGWR